MAPGSPGRHRRAPVLQRKGTNGNPEHRTLQRELFDNYALLAEEQFEKVWGLPARILKKGFLQWMSIEAGRMGRTSSPQT